MSLAGSTPRASADPAHGNSQAATIPHPIDNRIVRLRS
jgi:hypothetical protein